VAILYEGKDRRFARFNDLPVCTSGGQLKNGPSLHTVLHDKWSVGHWCSLTW